MSMDKKIIIKYVIAKSTGPLHDSGSNKGSLTIGKSYEVSHIVYAYKEYGKAAGNLRYNPSNKEFYIHIKEDDYGISNYIWNDCFYSTEELRDLVIDGILE